ncbi:MAG: antitoxin YefM [Frankiaceae bacterium]|jgi:prevent-host-death family protein|nr:antitoxin YefM [Frankiaceae bacterium]
MAILVAMSLADHVPLGDAKNRLSEYVERVEREHSRVVITKHGRPAVVVLSVDDLESLEETLNVLSDDQAVADIHEALREINRGLATALAKDEALALIRQD